MCSNVAPIPGSLSVTFDIDGMFSEAPGAWSVSKVLLEMIDLNGGGTSEDSSAHRSCSLMAEGSGEWTSSHHEREFLESRKSPFHIPCQNIYRDTSEVSSVSDPSCGAYFQVFSFLIHYARQFTKHG